MQRSAERANSAPLYLGTPGTFGSSTFGTPGTFGTFGTPGTFGTLE